MLVTPEWDRCTLRRESSNETRSNLPFSVIDAQHVKRSLPDIAIDRDTGRNQQPVANSKKFHDRPRARCGRIRQYVDVDILHAAEGHTQLFFQKRVDLLFGHIRLGKRLEHVEEKIFLLAEPNAIIG
jgi:hypothetical protein